MRKYLLAVLSAFVLSALAMQAQDLLKYNYKRNNYVYTGAERVEAASTTSPVYIKLGRIAFPDGVSIYVLRLDFESESAWKMPKNAGITFELENGSAVVAKHSGDAANLVAPEGIAKGGGKVFWNYGEYYLEESDIKKLLSGVSSLDAARRRSASGHVKLSFKNNSFSKALRRAYNAIEAAKTPSSELGRHVSGLNDTAGNRLASTETLDAGSGLSVYLNYLYSAENNSESYDLVLSVPGRTVAGGAAVTFITTQGERIVLKQEKNLPEGEVICYPENDTLKRMIHGVSRIVLETTSGEVSFNLRGQEFSSALGTLYNSLQTIAIL